MKSTTLLRLAFGLACVAPVLSIACGGGAPTPPATPTAPDTASAIPSASPTDSAAATGEASATPSASSSAAEPTAWKDMNHDQKLAYMKSTVMPKMKDEFVAFDGKRFADMSCKTCHGDGATDGSFKMPNAKLPPVPATKEGFDKLLKKKPAICKFMMEKVTPDMAGLLGEPSYDPKTQQGFGCHDCHTDGAAAKK